MTGEQALHYLVQFKEATEDQSGESMIDGGTAAAHLMQFGVSRELLSHIWCLPAMPQLLAPLCTALRCCDVHFLCRSLADRADRGALDSVEFGIAVHLTTYVSRGIPAPPFLPPTLLRPAASSSSTQSMSMSMPVSPVSPDVAPGGMFETQSTPGADPFGGPGAGAMMMMPDALSAGDAIPTISPTEGGAKAVQEPFASSGGEGVFGGVAADDAGDPFASGVGDAPSGRGGEDPFAISNGVVGVDPFASVGGFGGFAPPGRGIEDPFAAGLGSGGEDPFASAPGGPAGCSHSSDDSPFGGGLTSTIITIYGHITPRFYSPRWRRPDLDHYYHIWTYNPSILLPKVEEA